MFLILHDSVKAEPAMEEEMGIGDEPTSPSAKSRAPSIGESLYASTILSIEEETRRNNKQLNDQQWVLQRKRIGLSRRAMKTLQATVDSNKDKMTAINFIETHFNRKECVQFCPAPPSTDVCHCGSKETEHTSRSQQAHLFGATLESVTEEKVQDLQEKWRATTAIQELPTNAFGQLDFEGSTAKAAKYVRIADNATMSSVKEFIVEHWGLLRPRPHLALSIVGGAKNFHLDGRKKETFKSGLIGAARATNAWVLSGGTNTGVMKLVGEAVREGQFLVSDRQKMRRGLKAIGICSWGYTHDAESLINIRKGEFRKVRYNPNIEIKSKCRPPLNPDHTHFLMVDDGFREKYD